MKVKTIRSPWEEDSEENIYSEKSRHTMVEDDEITPLEEAFMEGWEEAEEYE